jgi:phage terminase small subunit
MKIFRETLPEDPIKKKKRGRPKGIGKSGSPLKRYIKIKRFVKEYLVDLNAVRAFQRCGYGTGNDQADNVNAGKLMARDDVIELIQEEERKRSERVEITQDMVLRQLALLAFANIRDISTWDGYNFVLKPFSELTRDQTAIISSIKVMPRAFGGVDIEFKTPSASDQRTALVDIGKHLGMFWEGNKEVDPVEAARKIREAIKESGERTAPKE